MYRKASNTCVYVCVLQPYVTNLLTDQPQSSRRCQWCRPRLLAHLPHLLPHITHLLAHKPHVLTYKPDLLADSAHVQPDDCGRCGGPVWRWRCCRALWWGCWSRATQRTSWRWWGWWW